MERRGRVSPWVLCGLIVCVTANVAAAQEAGLIVSYKGSAANYRLERRGRIVAIGYFLPVFEGDVLQASRNGRLVLDMADGSRPIVSSGARYVVRLPARTWPVSVTNLMREIGDALTRDKESEQVALVSRGPGGTLAFAISGLSNGKAQVASGNRIFALAWAGGRPPFSVLVRDARGRPTVDEAGVNGHELIKNSRNTRFGLGLYTIEILDAGGQRLAGRFVVVRPAAIPALPITLVPRVIDAPTRQLVDAAWLARANGGNLAYEAYLRAVPLTLSPEHDEAAALLLRQIYKFAEANAHRNQ